MIHYLLHKKYYAEVLCVNKSKPMMHCNGKCHLKKEIKEQNKNAENPNTPVPVPENNQEKYPVLINGKKGTLILFTNINNEFIYLIPLINNPYIKVPSPPPEINPHVV